MIIVKIMNKIVIFGSGGHAKVIFSEVIKLKKFKFLGFVDDFKKKGELIISSNKKNYYNLGSIKEVISKKNNLKGIIGVGLNFVREKIVKDIKKINNNFKFQQIISDKRISPKILSNHDHHLHVTFGNEIIEKDYYYSLFSGILTILFKVEVISCIVQNFNSRCLH